MLSLGCSKGREAVQDCRSYLEPRHLAVEVPGHEALTQQFDTVHLGFDATPTVIAAPSSPERAAEVFRRPQRFVARDFTCGDGLPKLGILARGNDGISSPFGDGIVALASIINSIGGDVCNLPIGRDLGEQLGQYGRISHIAAGEIDSPDFRGSLINSEVGLAPHTAFGDDINSTTCPSIRPIGNEIMSQLDQEFCKIGNREVRLLPSVPTRVRHSTV